MNLKSNSENINLIYSNILLQSVLQQANSFLSSDKNGLITDQEFDTFHSE